MNLVIGNDFFFFLSNQVIYQFILTIHFLQCKINLKPKWVGKIKIF